MMVYNLTKVIAVMIFLSTVHCTGLVDTVPLKSKLPPLVSFLARDSRLERRDSRRYRDETLVARDETLVSRDETLVSREPLKRIFWNTKGVYETTTATGGRLFCEPASPSLEPRASVCEPQKIPAKKSKTGIMP